MKTFLEQQYSIKKEENNEMINSMIQENVEKSQRIQNLERKLLHLGKANNL
jgi:hypothetical protein